MARTYDGDLLPDIVQLFNLSIAQPEPLTGPLPEVYDMLQDLLTNELAQESLPALIMGLAEQPLREGCIDALVTLAHNEQRREAVLQAVLDALRNPSRRLGAHQMLVRCGQIAAPLVCELVREHGHDLVKEARTILSEMGETAFPYIYQLAHDPQHRTHAEGIYQRIPVETIAKGLLACFASDDREKEEMAFYLLAMGLDDELMARAGSSSLTSSLVAESLAHIQSEVGLRTLSALLFLYRGSRAKMGQQIVRALSQTSVEHFSSAYTGILFLLGKDAVDPLDVAMLSADLPEHIRLELTGILAALMESEQVTAYVDVLAAGTNGTGNISHRALGLRALGGLLAGGLYHAKKLEKLRQDLSTSTKPQDRAAFEFFDVLLGKRNLPELLRLREQVSKQQEDLISLRKLTNQQEEELQKNRQYAQQAETRMLTFQKQLNRH
jgi:hypothetical protein